MPYHEDFEFYNALDRLPPPVPQEPGIYNRPPPPSYGSGPSIGDSEVGGLWNRITTPATITPDMRKLIEERGRDLDRTLSFLSMMRPGGNILRLARNVGRRGSPTYQYGQPDVPSIPARTGLPSPPIAKPGLPRSAPPRGPGLPSLSRGPEPERPVSKLPQIGSGPAPKRVQWNHSGLGGIETWRTPDGTIGSGKYYSWKASSGELGRSLSLYKVGGTYDPKTKEFYIDNIGPTKAGVQHYGRWGGGGTAPPDIKRGSYSQMQEVMGGRFKSAPLLSFVKAIKTQFPDVKWLSGDKITGIPGGRRRWIGKGRPTEADKSEIANLGRGFPYTSYDMNENLRDRGLLLRHARDVGELHARTIPEAWFEGEDPDKMLSEGLIEYIKEFWDKARGDPTLARNLRRRLDDWEREQ